MLVNPGLLLQNANPRDVLASAKAALVGFTPNYYWDFINNDAIVNGVVLGGVMKTPGITGTPRFSTEGLYVDAIGDMLTIPLTPPSNPFTIYVEFNRIVDTGAPARTITWDDGTANNLYALGVTSTDLGNSQVTTATVSQAAVNSVALWPLTPPKKLASRFDTNDVTMSFSGAATIQDNLATMPTGITTLRFGGSTSGGSLANGYIRRVAIFNSGLTNPNLVTITT